MLGFKVRFSGRLVRRTFLSNKKDCYKVHVTLWLFKSAATYGCHVTHKSRYFQIDFETSLFTMKILLMLALALVSRWIFVQHYTWLRQKKTQWQANIYFSWFIYELKVKFCWPKCLPVLTLSRKHFFLIFINQKKAKSNVPVWLFCKL